MTASKIEKSRVNVTPVIKSSAVATSIYKMNLSQLLGLVNDDTLSKYIPQRFRDESKSRSFIPRGFQRVVKREAAICKKLGKERNLIIATGGGAILRPENVDALQQNGTLVHITRSIDKLPTRGRPLSKNIETLKKNGSAAHAPLQSSSRHHLP